MFLKKWLKQVHANHVKSLESVQIGSIVKGKAQKSTFLALLCFFLEALWLNQLQAIRYVLPLQLSYHLRHPWLSTLSHSLPKLKKSSQGAGNRVSRPHPIGLRENMYLKTSTSSWAWPRPMQASSWFLLKCWPNSDDSKDGADNLVGHVTYVLSQCRRRCESAPGKKLQLLPSK